MSDKTKGGPDPRTALQHPDHDHDDEVHDEDISSSVEIPGPGVNFTSWLLTQHDRQDIVGHFLSEVAHDDTWPADTTSLHRLHRYLNQEHALDVVHTALSVAWHEWRDLRSGGVV